MILYRLTKIQNDGTTAYYNSGSFNPYWSNRELGSKLFKSKSAANTCAKRINTYYGLKLIDHLNYNNSIWHPHPGENPVENVRIEAVECQSLGFEEIVL